MAVEIAYQPGDTYVEVIVTGRLSAQEMSTGRDQVWAMVASDGVRGVLTDFSGASGMPPIGQLIVASVADPLPLDLRRALVAPPEFAREVSAIETFAINRGRSVAVFTDRDSAIEWLESA